MDIKEKIHSLSEDLLKNIERLVVINSQLGTPAEGMPFGPGPAKALDEALSIARELGFKTVNLDHYCGYAEMGEGDEIVGIAGHLDIVPCVGDWKHTAIGTTEEDDLIYGRGACDMKGGVAAMCSAAIALYRDKTPLNGKIRLTFVADEEDANLGMHAFLNTHEAATYTILGEPTNLHVAVAHRGVARYYIDLLGHACHAALRSTEETAVAKAARAVMAIEDLNAQLEAMKHDVLPSPSIVVTMMQGYEKDNVVPGKVRLLVDFRVLPGMNEPQTRKLVQDALDAHGIKGYELRKHFFMPGGEVDKAHPFVSACVKKAGELLDREEEPMPFGASCEQCFLVEAGRAVWIRRIR